MKVQNITNMSIYSRANNGGNSVSFGSRAKAGSGYSAGVAKDARKMQRTAFDELMDLTSDTANALKKSYEKSQIKKRIVQPTYEAWNKFSKKAPILSKATAYAACAAVGVGILQALKGNTAEE